MAIILFSFLIKLYLFSNVYQQSFYEYSNVLKYSFKNFFLLYISSIIFVFNYYYSNIYLTIVGYFIVAFQLFFIFARLKHPLKFTKRIIRMWCMIIIICIPFFYYDLVVLIDLLVLFIIFVADLILKPIQILINNNYLKKAREKYKKFEGKKIAVTGSYGKTSVKHYLANVLKNKYLVSYSPKSYNTPLGIARFLNASNLDLSDYIILEFGARRVGDINKLGKLFEIDIAVITEIGLMHIDKFISQQNIIDEKMSLIKYLSPSGFAILNYENEYIRKYTIDVMKFSYGFNHGDFRAKNIEINIFGSEFDLYIFDKFIKRIKLNLLGRQSVLNIMPSLIMCYLNDISFDVVKEVVSVSNRLSLRILDDYYILDDAYNSNILGSKYALEVIKTHFGKKFIITPGFVEMDKKVDILTKEYGKQISESVDVCILVKNSFTMELKKCLSDNLQIYYVNDFKEGFKLFLNQKNKDSILLIENDLPDAF